MSVRPRGFFSDAVRQLTRNKMSMVGLAVIVLFGTVAIAAPWLAPYRYDRTGFATTEPPSPGHPFGTDDLGRDMYSRVIYGARISMSVGFIAQAIVLVIGLALGLPAGYFGGHIDTVIMRFTDMMLAFPPLLFALLIMMLLGRSVTSLFIAIGLVWWPTMARLVRAEVMSIRQREFIESARAAGASDFRIMTRYVLPNIMTPIIVQVSFGIPEMILAEAFLSFIGIGVAPPTPSWGLILADGFRWIRFRPHLVLYAGTAISLTLLAFNFLGDGLRDALDPRIRH